MPVASIRDATRDVWANNLDDEMRVLRRLIDDFPFVSMVRVPGLGLRVRASSLWNGLETN